MTSSWQAIHAKQALLLDRAARDSDTLMAQLAPDLLDAIDLNVRLNTGTTAISIADDLVPSRHIKYA